LIENGAVVNDTNDVSNQSIFPSPFPVVLQLFDISSVFIKIFMSSTPSKQTGSTALMAACEMGHSDVALFLIEKGADIYSKDNVSTFNKCFNRCNRLFFFTCSFDLFKGAA